MKGKVNLNGKRKGSWSHLSVKVVMMDMQEEEKENKRKIKETKMKRTKETIDLIHVTTRKIDHTARDNIGTTTNNCTYPYYTCKYFTSVILDQPRTQSTFQVRESGLL